MKQILAGRHFETGAFVEVSWENGVIEAVQENDSAAADDLPWVAPGLLDLQINGHGGTWFNQQGLTVDEVINAVEPHFAFGVTRMLPTLVTNSREALFDGFAAIRNACERLEWVDRMVAGCHLEGPYISPEDGPRGAHPLEHVRAPDWDEFVELQAASGDRIRLLTLAPEWSGAIPFIEKATESGVTVAIGHTAALGEDIRRAVDAGARLSTHLGNGAHGTLRRHPNYLWDQLAEDRLMASIISDGHHLPDSVIRTIVRTKSVARTIITCDAAGLAGCPPGRYTEDGMDVEILEDGRIVIAGQEQLLAGSSLSTDSCIGIAVRAAGIELADAWKMASLNPARLLGLELPLLESGHRADLVLFDFDADSRVVVRKTIAEGECRFAT